MLKPLRALTVGGLALAPLVDPAGAIERVRVTTLRPLLVIAIDRGEAHGVLVGEAASAMAATFRSTSPIEIDVARVRRLEPGCARLSVTTRQDEVVDYNRQTSDARPGPKALRYQLNFCRDGRMPSGEAMPR